MKVFVVTSGCYSDYSIQHIFSTREMAVAWIGEGNVAESDYFSIEEYELDPLVDKTENIISSCGVDMNKDGSLANPVRGGFKSRYGAFEKTPRVRIWYTWDNKEYLETAIITRHDYEAVKATNEIRLRILALDRWPKFTKGKTEAVSFNYETLEPLIGN